MKKSNLDEMQEQKLLRLEHNAWWLAYALLLIDILVQIIAGLEPTAVLGECAILVIACGYMIYGCLKHGIWDRRFKPNLKTNLVFSLIGSLFIGVFTYFLVADVMEEPLNIAVACLISMGFVFMLCFAAMSLCAALYKKRREKLDQE